MSLQPQRGIVVSMYGGALIRKSRTRGGSLVWIVALMWTLPLSAAERLVADQAAYREAVRRATPGDVIVLKDGEWRDFQILFHGVGEPGKPITLTAQTQGRVLITGKSNLSLAGEHLVVSGLVFRDGYTPTEAVIAFRQNSQKWASHTRVTEVVIDRFNPPERRRQDLWVALHGQFNRVDHSHFVGKTNAGVTLAVIRQAGAPLDNRHRIDHNYFGFRPPLGSNGGETLRIGTSDESLSDSNSVIERNYFERCDGEVEIVSNKSGGNTFRDNTFFESQGSLVLRHGNRNVVEGNVFFGNGKPHTGGIRVINAQQTIRNNYMEGLAGDGFASALAVMNGVPNSALTRYHQVTAALIENNSFIDASHITLGVGADAERTAVPTNSRFERNLVVNQNGADAFVVQTDIAGIAISGNVQNNVTQAAIGSGITRRSVALARAANGLLYPTDPELAKVGAPRTLAPVTRAEAGATWYPKPDSLSADFMQGRTHRVTSPSGRALAEAIAKAASGDTIRLDAGSYRVDAPIVIDRAVRITGPAGATPATLQFRGPSLFALANGATLHLQRLQISGAAAPVTAGNVVFGFSDGQAPAHYSIGIFHSNFIELNRSPDFDVMATAPESFAQHIEIRDSSFKDVSGAVIAARTRNEGDAAYGVERVDIVGSRFQDVGRVVDLFRGGRDESTFGPRFTMADSTIERSGRPSGISMRLSGVLFTTITGNRFSDSGSIDIAHGIGAPQTSITGNTFANTSAPVVRELYAKGPPRAVIKGNVDGAVMQ